MGVILLQIILTQVVTFAASLFFPGMEGIGENQPARLVILAADSSHKALTASVLQDHQSRLVFDRCQQVGQTHAFHPQREVHAPGQLGRG